MVMKEDIVSLNIAETMDRLSDIRATCFFIIHTINGFINFIIKK